MKNHLKANIGKELMVSRQGVLLRHGIARVRKWIFPLEMTMNLNTNSLLPQLLSKKMTKTIAVTFRVTLRMVLFRKGLCQKGLLLKIYSAFNIGIQAGFGPQQIHISGLINHGRWVSAIFIRSNKCPMQDLRPDFGFTVDVFSSYRRKYC